MAEEIIIPSLQELCERHFSQGSFPRSVEDALMTVDKLQGMYALQGITNQCVMYLRQRAEYLHEKYDVSSLIHILGPEETARQQQDILARAESRRIFAHMTTGAVIDRPLPPTIVASEEGFYPYASLCVGVKWPPDVDPSQREKHLSAQEFRTVFKMSKEEFAKLPPFVRLRMKKEVGMY